MNEWSFIIKENKPLSSFNNLNSPWQAAAFPTRPLIFLAR
jgi:hypothetical protein